MAAGRDDGQRPAASAIATRPRLKGVVWERVGDELRVVYDRREQLLVSDPDGMVAVLLEQLRDGGRTEAELAAALSDGRDPVPVADVQVAIALLDEYRLVEDGSRLGLLASGEAERHFSNLAFFESFASLAHSREDFCRRLRDSHVRSGSRVTGWVRRVRATALPHPLRTTRLRGEPARHRLHRRLHHAPAVVAVRSGLPRLRRYTPIVEKGVPREHYEAGDTPHRERSADEDV